MLQDRRSEPRPLPSCPRDPQGRGHSAGKGSRRHRTSAAACAIWAWGRNVGRVPGTGHLISQCPPPAPSAPGASTGDAIGYQHRQGREEPSHGALSRPRAHGRPCGGRVWPQLPLHVSQATRADTHSHAPIPDATRGQAAQRSQGASPAGPHPPGPEAGIPRGHPQLSARGHHEGQLCAHRPRTQDPAPRTPAQKRASSGVCLPWLQCSARAARPPRSHCRHQSSKGPTRGPGPAGCPRESGTGHGGGSHPLARCSSVPPRPQRLKAQARPRGPGASSPGSCGILAACGEGLGVPSAFLKGSRVLCSDSVAAPLQLEGTDEEGRSEPEHRHGALRFGSDPRWERHPQAAASRVSTPPRPGASPRFSEKSCPREGPGLPRSDPPPAPGTWFSAGRLPSQRRPPPPPGPQHPAPCPWRRSRGLSSAAWGVPGGNASEASAQAQESRVKQLNCWFSCSWNLPPAQGRPHAAGGPREAVPSRRRPRPPSRGTKKRRKERPPALSHAAPPGRQVVGSPPPPSRRQPCSRESGRQLARGLSLGGLGSAGRPQLHSTRVLGATPLEPPPSLCRDLPRLCGSLPPPGPYTPYSLPTCPAPP